MIIESDTPKHFFKVHTGVVGNGSVYVVAKHAAL